MISHEPLEMIIRRYVMLGPSSSKGYEQLKCAVCNDYKIRAGFKFDGERIDYHCFNCGCHASYDPSFSRHSITNKMKNVLLAFGIPDDEITRSVSFNFFKRTSSTPTQSEPRDEKLCFPTRAISLPEPSTVITSDASPWCEVAREYLTSRRLPVTSNYYVSDNPSYEGRVIICYMFRGKIIYWQGRAIDESIEPRYKNPVVEKDNIFFNMDELYRHTTEPLYVTEGPLDAASIGDNAIALTGSTLTEFKIKELTRVAERRRVVFVIDKNDNGYKLGMQALSHGFFVTVFPDNVDDANVALQRYGKLWLVAHLAQTTETGFAGRLLLNMKCERKKEHGTRKAKVAVKLFA